MTRFLKTKKGFTLIELLVVIAIIGVLASIVLASLNTARMKGRDVRRIADIGQLRLALELYFDSARSYPGCATCSTATADLTAPLAPTYIGSIPIDPLSTQSYNYQSHTNASPPVICTDATNGCAGYILQAKLEDGTHTALGTDYDLTAVLGSVNCADSGGGPGGSGDTNKYYCVKN